MDDVKVIKTTTYITDCKLNKLLNHFAFYGVYCKLKYGWMLWAKG